MREAIGGTWLLGFVVIFIVLFSGYLAVSINYTKAFKIKNKIISIIEENEGFTESLNADLNALSKTELDKDESVQAEIFKYLKAIGYYNTSDVNCDADEQEYDNGYCIKAVTTDSGSAYYKVKTFIKFNLDMVNISVQIPISGETKVIYYDRNS